VAALGQLHDLARRGHASGRLKSTRPIEFAVERPEEAAGMFDVLTYEKGASVLRMLEQYLGAEAFREGIRLYLRRHAYGNAETTDLWDAIEDATRQPARALMDTWIFQPGYPLMSVEKQGKGIRLSQRIFRYLQDGSDRGAQVAYADLSARRHAIGCRHQDIFIDGARAHHRCRGRSGVGRRQRRRPRFLSGAI
jgi:aminopeptidase N